MKKILAWVWLCMLMGACGGGMIYAVLTNCYLRQVAGVALAVAVFLTLTLLAVYEVAEQP